MINRFITVALCVSAAILTAKSELPARGYRGLMDLQGGVVIASPLADIDKSGWSMSVSTTHGYQFFRELFVGGGIMMNYRTATNTGLCVPVFVAVRTDPKFGLLTPFAEARFGYYLTQSGHCYFSPTVGYRFHINSLIGINVGLTYTMRFSGERMYDRWWVEYPDPGSHGKMESRYLGRFRESTLSVSLGFDF